MREDICSVPVSEIFGEVDGCPLCRMRDIIEQRLIDYILGAAMMEPDVRKTTNKEGFCFKHFKMMSKKQARLPLALMLESHLDETKKTVFGKGDIFKNGKARAEIIKKSGDSCFICKRTESSMRPQYQTVTRLYEEQREFREMFLKQNELCLVHYAALCEAADGMSKRYKSEFNKEIKRISEQTLETIKGDVEHFCKMFDYRSKAEGAEWGNSKDSIERTIKYLTSLDPENNNF